MGTDYTEIRVSGKTIKVPACRIGDRTVIVTGKLLRIASVHDDDLIEGEVVIDPDKFIEVLKTQVPRPDVFTFAQHLPDVRPRYRFYAEWDNVAVIPIASFEDWWMKRVSSDLRKDVRRSAKRGVAVRPAVLDDAFVNGIIGIYNEAPIRQGRRFWHYGKDFATVKAETETYLNRSEFLGAYLNDELIGFLKIVYVGRIARLMFIISKTAHQDKRPTNALIAKAVEIAALKGCSHLTYGNYTYRQNANSALTAFKHRNGFESLSFPRYYVPLTLKGKLLLQFGLHHGAKGIMPERLVNILRQARLRIYHGAFTKVLGSAAPLGSQAECKSTEG